MTARVVVVGVSLGASSALRVLLQGLPPGFAPPVVIASHRHRAHDGGLVSVLAPHSALPLCEPDDKARLEAGHVYLAPADYHTLIGAEGIELSIDPRVLHARPSIDVLFESAAEVYGPDVIAVVLTGASADGARGAAAVRRMGGRVLVQDPATAERREMPEAALPSADQVLPLERIAAELCTEAPS